MQMIIKVWKLFSQQKLKIQEKNKEKILVEIEYLLNYIINIFISYKILL
jgi:hypothetical protein